MADFLVYSRLQDSAVHRSWLRERVVAIYIFAWLVFATSLLSERLVRNSWQKVFWKVLSSLPQGKICKSVEKNFYLFFIPSLIDMMEIFNVIYRWLPFSGLPNSLGLIVSGETSAIFSLVPRCSLLPRCPREVWEKAGERVSLADVTSHELRTLRAEAELLLLSSALLLLVMSTLLLRARELSPKVG